MSKSTEYTCDRCGTKTTYGTAGWVAAKTGSYSESDYCPSCVAQLLKVGCETEAVRATKQTQTTNEKPF